MRFSQAISEGDGISLIVDVADATAARAAESQGAEAVVVRAALGDGVDLPVLWRGSSSASDASAAGADAWVIRVTDATEDNDDFGLDRVVEVCNEEELELALGQLDPEILLFSVGDDDDADALQRALDLLPDLPAGKLAVAEVAVSSREQVVELERAGVDAVIVGARDVAELVGDAPPPV
jgi:Indole-3-glycerol phosphate synthase